VLFRCRVPGRVSAEDVLGGDVVGDDRFAGPGTQSRVNSPESDAKYASLISRCAPRNRMGSASPSPSPPSSLTVSLRLSIASLRSVTDDRPQFRRKLPPVPISRRRASSETRRVSR